MPMPKERVDAFVKKLSKEVQEAQKDVELAESLIRLKEVAKTYAGEDEVILTPELITMVKLRAKEPIIPTGWSGLDAILGGFRLQQLIVVSAPTKSGKTSWCMDLTSRLKTHKPLWMPFEEGAEELIEKYLERDLEPPLFATPKVMKGNTLDWLEMRLIESIVKYGTDIMIIDHLHFIVPFSEERQDLRIGQVMRDLKAMAKKWNVVIVLIAHLKKTRVDSQPTLEEIRDSSFVAQEADTVILLWREQFKERGQLIITNNVNVSVQANRRTGKTGNVKMSYVNGVFIEGEWESRDEAGAKAEKDFHNF